MKLSTVLRSAALSVLALTASAAFAQTQWAIDAAHSQAAFTIRHMGISNVNGRFGNISGTVVLDPSDLTKSSVKATIDVTTVDTGVAQRDGHLKSPDFFDVAKFPTMTFVSKSVSKSGDDYVVQGDLTMHGVTKPVTLKLDAPDKEQTGPDNKLHRGFSASTVLHRQDFGLVWNGTLKSGDNMLGDDVKVQLDIEAVKQ
ncbi:YceI family protein [Silvibacterium acidisoli]|uniref:YceI family protein n=1 Tax=Acidobacteriaceae bacterium ZG23-2 TaxID=2883246 RepID=UPI00406BF025